MDELKPATTRSGTVKRLPPERNFGFIREDVSKEDIFFHKEELIDMELEDLALGDRVIFFVIREAGGNNKGELKCIEVCKDHA